jgi:hypothetical protein
VFAALAGLAIIAAPALGQNIPPQPENDVPQIAQTPQMPYPGVPPQAAPGAAQPSRPMTLSDLYGPEGTPAPPAAGMPAPYTGGFGTAFEPGTGLAGGGGSAALAASSMYIDTAIIRTRIRVRYDSEYEINTPDKAEFFYAKCGCFANPNNFARQLLNGPAPGVLNLGAAAQAGYDPKARGPQHAPAGNPNVFGGDPKINAQELTSYFEYAANPTFSTFVEVPVRFLNPTLVRNFYGFSDINAGFKCALVAEPDRYYTFQLRGYAPTGAADRGLGTGHVSLEPAFLVFQMLSDRLIFNGEVRDWIPIGGSNFAGNVIRYGVGLTYNLVLTDHLRIAPMEEVVGWSILSGKELQATGGLFNPGTTKSVSDQTIVNEKIGLQIGIGNYTQAGGGSMLNDRHTLGVSYGRVLTGDHWYKDIIRVEYNFWF